MQTEEKALLLKVDFKNTSAMYFILSYLPQLKILKL